MESLVWLIPALLCPLGMLLMMWMMGKGMMLRGKGDGSERRPLSELRAEKERLEAEIADRKDADRDASVVQSAAPRRV
jgi:hypothetical protein